MAVLFEGANREYAMLKAANDPALKAFIENGGKATATMTQAQYNELMQKVSAINGEIQQVAKGGGSTGNTSNVMKAIETMKAQQAQEAARAAQPSPTVTKLPMSDIKLNNGMNGGLREVSAATKYDSEGRPIRNNYLASTDMNGNLLNQFSLTGKLGDDVNLNTQGMDAIRGRALSTEQSPWAKMATDKLAIEEQNAADKANRQGAAAQNQAYNELASRGGLSGGQRERLAMQGQRGLFQANQDIKNQGLLNRLNVNLQDQQSKDQMLMQLPGMDMNKANFDQSQRAYRNTAQDLDIQRGMKDVTGLNAFNAGAYTDEMQAWGAAKSADAQAKAARSSGGGGLLGGLFG
jgi:hypothetical protein